jgi:hypothetical protein
VFTTPLRSNGVGTDHRKHHSFLLLRVDSLSWKPVCLRSLPSNVYTRYNMIFNDDITTTKVKLRFLRWNRDIL